jgi:hypothetical protein
MLSTESVIRVFGAEQQMWDTLDEMEYENSSIDLQSTAARIRFTLER